MNRARSYWVGGASILVSGVILIIPFAFIVLMSLKDRREASLHEFSLPTNGIHLWDNIVQVVSTRDFMLITAAINSTILTVASVTVLVILGAMVGYLVQRRRTILTPIVNICILAGLIIPPAIVPTIWTMQGLGIFATLHGLTLIEVAYGLAFTVLGPSAKYALGLPQTDVLERRWGTEALLRAMVRCGPVGPATIAQSLAEAEVGCSSRSAQESMTQ